MKRRAVFLDKDGTLVVNVPYNVAPELVRLNAGAIDGLQALQSAGYRLFVISNQAGIAHGMFNEEQLDEAYQRLRGMLADADVELTGFYYCPHHPEGIVSAYARECDCRKPHPGLIYRAASDHHLDLRRSWFIGDILDDVEAGNRAGCRTVLLDQGTELGKSMKGHRRPNFMAQELLEACHYIVRTEPPWQRSIAASVVRP